MDVEQLVAKAKEAKQNAYCPYSHFPVGAAVLYKSGEVITGVNVENVSFGATNCAERTALFAGIAKGYHKEDVMAIAISGDTEDFLPPCSICRQVMVELCDYETPVYLSKNNGEIMELTLKALVPYAFTDMDI
ncbi:cytidine deaminase homotetrameric [Trichococcus palustris]|jgi:cytidine deaminase|uniref:Cytidine deaminase n=1 Tax=Trichococcus palustris TaxID=140314 RepID=A0A143Y780_9LACT|nr:cytidine deaminase [Trichococcus palustris]CZQ81183.1 cytidine deaminase homotetrameric [Trichococcus palustris]SFK63121.1 cytidine deaminase [Trichococcus palustris]